MRALLQDLRYAVRQLRGSLGFTVLVTVTVALGIGANTGIFSMLNGFLRPLPVRAPEQIVFLAAQTKGDETGFAWRFSYPALEDFRKQADCFSDVFAFNAMIAGFGADGKQVTQLLYSAVSGNFFSGLRLTPAAGRLFVPGEGEKPGSELVMVLGYSFWQKRFGGSPAAIGKQARINGRPVTIVGVVPKNFYGLYSGAEMDGYLPLNSLTLPSWGSKSYPTNRTLRYLTIVARMKPRITFAQAQRSSEVVTRRMEAQYPGTDRDVGVRVIPETLARPMPLRYLADRIPTIRALLLVLAGLVLLLACMNVANVLMVRATVRQREMAIRAALGSGRGRLIRQMLTESMLLAILGGAAGLVFGKWASDGFAASIDLKTDFPIRLDFHFDWRVFAYAFAAAVVTGIAIGIWPAFRASRANAGAVLHDGVRGDSSGRARQRFRSLLVVTQVAGSLVLLLIAALFARSLQTAQRMDLGFDPDHLLNARMDPAEIGYDLTRANQFYRELERRVRAIPGVQSASLAFSVPISYIFSSSDVYIEGRMTSAGEQPPQIQSNSVDADYFETMRIPIVRGRAFHETDNEQAPLVTIVNQTMARRFWPNQDPLGKRLRIKPDGPFFQVVGVARDSKYLVVFEDSLPYLYFPLSQYFSSMRVLQVRTQGPPQQLLGRIQQEIQVLDPEMPVADLQTMRQALSGGMGFMMFRVGAIQAGTLGLLGLVLAVIGVYGVVSYGASQRTREIGIRMALGAEPAHVRSLVLGQGLLLVISGVLLGAAAAAGLTILIHKYVLSFGSSHALIYGAVALVLAGIALFACYIPARRAMRVDPVVALRHE